MSEALVAISVSLDWMEAVLAASAAWARVISDARSVWTEEMSPLMSLTALSILVFTAAPSVEKILDILIQFSRF